MKRDLDLIRYLLCKIEENPTTRNMQIESFVCDQYDAPTISYHIELLLDCNFIEARHISVLGTQYRLFTISRLTSFGHDYLDNIRDDSIWKNTKDKLGSLANSASLQIVSNTAVALIKARLGI